MFHYRTELPTENGHTVPVDLRVRQFFLYTGRPPGERLVLDDYDVVYAEDGTEVPVDVLDEAVELAPRAARSIEAMIIYA